MRHQVDEDCKIKRKAQDIMKDRYHHQQFTATIKSKVGKLQLKVKKILLFKSEIFKTTWNKEGKLATHKRYCHKFIFGKRYHRLTYHYSLKARLGLKENNLNSITPKE